MYVVKTRPVDGTPLPAVLADLAQADSTTDVVHGSLSDATNAAIHRIVRLSHQGFDVEPANVTTDIRPLVWYAFQSLMGEEFYVEVTVTRVPQV